MIFENGEVSFIDHSKPEANEKLTTYLQQTLGENRRGLDNSSLCV
jgi:hypothetical protein